MAVGASGPDRAGGGEAFSAKKLPEAFLSRMKELLSEQEYAAFLSSYGQERLFSLRVNPLKCSREAFLELLSSEADSRKDFSQQPSSEAGSRKDFSQQPSSEAGSRKDFSQQLSSEEGSQEDPPCTVGSDSPCALRPVPWEPDGFYYPHKLRPGRLPWHEAGMYYIQESSAMAPAVLLGVRPGERILDLCAAPGGKSTKLAASLRGEGLIVANEIHPERAKILSANLERMGVRNAVVTNETPQRLASFFPFFFDRIAVDAPCSGEGMFRKEEEALAHWSPENVRMCAERQLDILEEAAAMLKRGGTLVYSTCTFSPEENEGVIARFLAAHPEFAPVDVWTLPGNGPEAGEAEAAGESLRQGLEPDKWGFERGRPQWAYPEGRADSKEDSARTCEGQFSRAVDLREAFPEEDSAARACEGQTQTAVDLRGADLEEGGERLPSGHEMLSVCAVRLWPHRVPGEGHFAAVLRKKGGGSMGLDAPAGTVSGYGRMQGEDSGSGTDKNGMPAADLSGSEGFACGLQAGTTEKKSVKRNRKGVAATAKGHAGRQNGRKNRGGEHDPNRRQALRLWKEFREEALRLPEGLFPEENILLFGETLCALPFPADTLPLDGLRVVRPGLELGDVKKGRFTPAHALAMALKGPEAAQSISLPGRSNEAYAWIRGEAIRISRISSEGTADFGEDPVLKKGWILVTIDGCGIGWGKIAENPSDDGTAVVKNHYPKGLRRGGWLPDSR